MKVKKIRVLVIDDSLVVRSFLKRTLEGDDLVEAVGLAGDPHQGVKMIKEFRPDLITLDIEMPKMSGLEFLKKLMRSYPLPVIMISSLTKRGSQQTLKALETGAVDFILKKNLSNLDSRKDFKEELLRKVRGAARVKMSKLSLVNKRDPLQAKINVDNRGFLIAIGASTGGVTAIKEVLKGIPKNSPPIIIIQHMPASFTISFANSLNRWAKVNVKEGSNNDRLIPGEAILVPGGYHAKVNKDREGYFITLNREEKVHHQRPAVDVTFNSIAGVVGSKAIGVLLTGMGSDGAKGLKAMKVAGGHTIAESKETATIYGMPRKAIEMGAAVDILPLNKVGEGIINYLNR